jgi:sugar transferase (PEP-CTERM system associated)
VGTVRFFKHHIHTAFIWLATLEVLLFMCSVFIGAYLRFGDAAIAEGHTGDLWPRALTFSVVMLLSMAAMGLYQTHMREGSSGELIRIAGAFIAMSLVMSAIFYLFPGLLLWRGALALTALSAFTFTLLTRAAFSRLVDQQHLKRKVLVFGSGKRANQILSLLRRTSDRRGFVFVGFVHIEGEDDVVEPSMVVTLGQSLSDYVVENDIDEILVAVDDRRRSLPIDDLLACKFGGVDVVDTVSFFEREIGKIMLDLVTPGWMVFSDGFKFGVVRIITKRVFDISASLFLLMGTWPMMLAAVIAIYIEDGFGAPIIYRQRRVGINGEVFDVFKFRSMSVDAEKDGQAVWAKKNDARVTKVGSFIRQYRVDELPQIFNVLKGDMSFVGPRPERPHFVQRLSDKIPYYEARHQVKPGIAGWAQLCYPYGASDEDAMQKLQFDLYYVKNNSLFLDMLILIQTVEVVLFGKGAR